MNCSNCISTEILSLFTDVAVKPSARLEDFSEFKVEYSLELQKFPQITDYLNIISNINSRDHLHLSVLQYNEIVGNFTNRNDDNFQNYIDVLNRNLTIGTNIELIITIEKNKIINVISIYSLNDFVKYLGSLSFLTFLTVIEKYSNKEKIVLENQNDSADIDIFCTKTISLINKNTKAECEILDNQIRERIILRATSLCLWDAEKKHLLPEDLYPIVKDQTNNDLIIIFQKACLLYVIMFVFDYLKIKEKSFLYKLNGYKTFGEEIITEKITDISIDFNSVDLFYLIYQWIYSGGNATDKISIARNIISLNYNPQTLELSKTTFDAIRSNFKIFEHQNVKQYIEVRNKLSEILIDLQGKIDKIVDNFIGDYKKNIITLLSFFISVIAIRVVSKGDFIGGFTLEIIILSFSLLLISIGALLYSRWEFSNRISMFDKHYKQLKDRYKDLLSEDESNNIFEECNPKNKGSKSFINQQKKFYTILWVCTIAILTVAIFIIYVLNYAQSFCFIRKTIELLCYIKNTLV